MPSLRPRRFIRPPIISCHSQSRERNTDDSCFLSHGNPPSSPQPFTIGFFYSITLERRAITHHLLGFRRFNWCLFFFSFFSLFIIQKISHTLSSVLFISSIYPEQSRVRFFINIHSIDSSVYMIFLSHCTLASSCVHAFASLARSRRSHVRRSVCVCVCSPTSRGAIQKTC